MTIAAIFIASTLAGLVALFVALRRLGWFGAALPSDRSNHSRPTPQIGGIALVSLWLLAMVAATAIGSPVPVFGHPAFLAAVVLLFATGVIDDRRPLGAAPKLAAQCAAALLAMPALSPLLADLPVGLTLSVPLAIFMLVAIVNLTNFIDGLDLMAVTTIGMPALAFAFISGAGLIAADMAAAGAVLAGLMAAFAVVNRPPARTFLGDGGSLPFGLILGAMAVIAACLINPVVGVLLPAYILFDGVYTFIRRATAGENVLRAHSSHVYQRAFRNGRSPLLIAALVALFGAFSGGAAWWAGSAGTIAAAALALAATVGAWIALAGFLLRR